MALEDRDSGRSERQLLTECPVCRADLSGYTKTSDHFLSDHLPEDFGLTPLGTISDGFEAPLFEDSAEVTTSAQGTRVLADGGQPGGERRVK